MVRQTIRFHPVPSNTVTMHKHFGEVGQYRRRKSYLAVGGRGVLALAGAVAPLATPPCGCFGGSVAPLPAVPIALLLVATSLAVRPRLSTSGRPVASVAALCTVCSSQILASGCGVYGCPRYGCAGSRLWFIEQYSCLSSVAVKFCLSQS